jgi:succinate-semialdehyde dehydrogenase/glutarate-semialdehyde dehydrogenase
MHPNLILEDADLDKTFETCVTSRLLNSGQSCIAAKRFVVVEAVCRQFEQMLVERMQAKRMGNPLDEAVEIGPQARFDLRDDLHRQVTQSITKGAVCLLGGNIPEGTGTFYPATVLGNVGKGMPAYEEEIFGPVRRYQGKRLWERTLPLRSKGVCKYKNLIHSIDQNLIK